MRHIVWLAGCLLVLSCTVNSDNLNTDAGGTGGGSGGAGTGGATATGGQVGTGGATATGGQVGTGGATATGGQVGTGGATATGGQVGTGGQIGTGGATATGGKTGTGGSATGGHGAGGNGTGGAGGKGCDALESDYGSALTAAKKCTPGATNQCQQLVGSSLSCPGCKQYVNDTTALSAIQTAWDSQNCSSVPHVCPAIACVVPTTSVCASTGPTTGGPNAGADPSGTCSVLLTPAN
jgi:hypothetical protein